MKKIISLIVLAALLSRCNSDVKPHHTPLDKAGIEAQILKNLEEQKQSWNAGDIPLFMEHYWQNDSMAFMSSTGIRYGWQETKDSYLKNYPTQDIMGELQFEVKKLDVLSKSSAYMLGSWYLERDTLDAGGHFSLIWKKKNDKWVIVTDHTS